MDEKYYLRLREVRDAKKLTQKQLSNKVGISPGSLSAYEKGTKTPPVNVAARIADTLGVSLDWLFGLEKKETISQTPKTYADVVKLFLLISGAFPIAFPSVRVEKLNDDPRVTKKNEALLFQGDAVELNLLEHKPADVYYASLDIPDLKLMKFFFSWKKFYELLKDGTVDEEVYNVWVEKQLSELESIPLQYTWPDKADPKP